MKNFLLSRTRALFLSSFLMLSGLAAKAQQVAALNTASISNPGKLTVYQGKIYGVGNGGIYTLPTSGGNPTMVPGTQATNPTAVTVVDGTIYFASNSKIFSTTGDGTITHFAGNGDFSHNGDSNRLTAPIGTMTDLVADGNDIMGSSANGYIYDLSTTSTSISGTNVGGTPIDITPSGYYAKAGSGIWSFSGTQVTANSSGHLDDQDGSTLLSASGDVVTEVNKSVGVMHLVGSTDSSIAGMDRSGGTTYVSLSNGNVGPLDNFLPVELVTFEGSPTAGGNLLTWQTASETNNAGFDVQESANGQDWFSLNFVPSNAANGTTSTPQEYTYTDTDPLTVGPDNQPVRDGTTYYRLKQSDFDGPSEYSDIIPVKSNFTPAAEVVLFPNPARSGQEIRICGLSQESTSFSYSISDATGRNISDHVSDTFNGQARLDINDLSPGMYLLTSDDNSIPAQRFVIAQ